MKTAKTGAIGEEIAVNFLKKKGFKVQGQNYRRPWGEIDVIAEKGEKTHFIEVKTRSMKAGKRPYLSGETAIHPKKIERIERAIMTYLEGTRDPEWQLDVVCIDLDHENKKAHTRYIPGVF